MKFNLSHVIVQAAVLAFLFAPEARAADGLDFDRDIRPILSDNCFTCHGPDANERKAKLRLDTLEGLLAEPDGQAIVKPGDRNQSELYRRITAKDPDDIMPPEESAKKLTTAEIELLGQWIDQGAKWEPHWAFVPPKRPAPPAVQRTEWVKNPIDQFVLSSLEKENLEPSPEASKTALARRATLDLTGLPPSVEEVDAFLNDEDPRAYEALVDRLLNSPKFGEQRARYWLDAARYADTHGYHIDAERIMWPWREWVIEAFNDNTPFDQFTIEQLAGDLLPEPTREQKIATGFNRNNMTTGEGGAIAEDYRVKYGIDRVDTTSTVWLGLTMACAQCHDHKYDPLSQKEFYEFFAMFNTIDEPALDGNRPNPEPFLKTPSPDQERRMAELNGAIAKVAEEMDGPMPEVDKAQEEWEAEWARILKDDWRPLDFEKVASLGGATLKKLEDKSILASGPNPDTEVYEFVTTADVSGIRAIRLEALTDKSFVKEGAGRSFNSNFILTGVTMEIAPKDDPDAWREVKWLGAAADFAQKDFPVSNAIDGKKESGWGVEGHNRPEERLAVFVPEGAAGFGEGTRLRFRLKFESEHKEHTIGRVRLAYTENERVAQAFAPLKMSPWRAVGPFFAVDGNEAFATEFGPEGELDFGKTYKQGDRELKWERKEKFADGQVNTLEGENAATYLHRTITVAADQPATISLGSDDAIRVWLNGEEVLSKNVQRGAAADQDQVTLALRPGRNDLLMKIVNYGTGYGFYFKALESEGGVVPAAIATLFATGRDQWNDENKKQVREHFRRTKSPRWAELADQRKDLEEERKQLDAAIPTTLVMREMEKPRETFMLNRGEYDQPTEKVAPGTPDVLPPLPEGEADRLALAKWLVNPNHPLTARVTVNRFWQQYFGVGLVKTSEDFGSQGARPSHPKLLDWLAREFIESGWDMKHLHRLIVTSATYRQSSKVSPELAQRDPENRLLARGPRFRMDAEMVRDNALAISGLLAQEIGGPSVKPYEPPGLWEAVSYGFSQKYQVGSGSDLYRRSLYTFWKRQSPPPNMVLLDAPTRETCSVRRPRTNTPLQALALMNDPQYVEAARAFATKIMEDGGETTSERIAFAFRRATARSAKTEEIETIKRLFEAELRRFREDPEAAKELIGSGDGPPNPEVDATEQAAWTVVANLILNLDETITKG